MTPIKPIIFKLWKTANNTRKLSGCKIRIKQQKIV
jgi:hypothetical protein